MILDRPDASAMRRFAPDVCVIGSGAVGLTTAIGLLRRGIRVLVLESGRRRRTRQASDLAEAECLSPDHHFRPSETVMRRLGGTTNIWGGRCLPLDPIDFRARPWLGLPAWPISQDDLAPHLAEAVALLGAGAAVFSAPLPSLPADPAFTADSLERWSITPAIQRLHRRRIERDPDLLIGLGCTVTGFAIEGERVVGLHLHVEGRGRDYLPVRQVVLAAGGNESTRLLLLEQRRHPDLFGGREGPLGRFYMGHLSGRIADIAFADPLFAVAFDFHIDPHGSYVRRRIVPAAATQEAAGLANIAFWPVVPRIADPAHRSGPLSALYLALSFPPIGRALVAGPVREKHVGAVPARRRSHIRNLVADLPHTLRFLPVFLWRNRLTRLRLPGFFLPNRALRYGLAYHAEQLPNPASRLTLSDATDRLGMARLRIDLRFTTEDAERVVRGIDALGRWLERNRLARLLHHHPAEERAAAVLQAARDGTHQIGTIRMGHDRRHAVVDSECRCFDLPNLFVVSTAVMPSSGQANPTLTAVQLGLRVAERLAREIRRHSVTETSLSVVHPSERLPEAAREAEPGLLPGMAPGLGTGLRPEAGPEPLAP